MRPSGGAIIHLVTRRALQTPWVGWMIAPSRGTPIMSTADPSLIALDWGTTSLRAYLLGTRGEVLDRAEAPCGVMQLPREGFQAAFEQTVGAWRARWPALEAIASGMVGSTQGWVEAPYIDCPGGPGELAGHLTRVPGASLWVVPGMAQREGAPNVMRGEESQVLGALHLQPGLQGAARLLLPGTHSKWVTVEAGRVTGFETYMTGEIFALLSGHSILGRLASDAPPLGDEEREAGFERGVAAVSAAPLMGLLFSVRALVLTGHLQPGQSLPYLSGLLIGDELRSAGIAPQILIGDPGLCAHYRRAMGLLGMPEAPILDAAEATTAGLWQIARQAGLITRRGDAP